MRITLVFQPSDGYLMLSAYERGASVHKFSVNKPFSLQTKSVKKPLQFINLK